MYNIENAIVKIYNVESMLTTPNGEDLLQMILSTSKPAGHYLMQQQMVCIVNNLKYNTLPATKVESSLSKTIPQLGFLFSIWVYSFAVCKRCNQEAAVQ